MPSLIRILTATQVKSTSPTAAARGSRVIRVCGFEVVDGFESKYNAPPTERSVAMAVSTRSLVFIAFHGPFDTSGIPAQLVLLLQNGSLYVYESSGGNLSKIRAFISANFSVQWGVRAQRTDLSVSTLEERNVVDSYLYVDGIIHRINQFDETTLRSISSAPISCLTTRSLHGSKRSSAISQDLEPEILNANGSEAAVLAFGAKYAIAQCPLRRLHIHFRGSDLDQEWRDPAPELRGQLSRCIDLSLDYRARRTDGLRGRDLIGASIKLSLGRSRKIIAKKPRDASNHVMSKSSLKECLSEKAKKSRLGAALQPWLKAQLPSNCPPHLKIKPHDPLCTSRLLSAAARLSAFIQRRRPAQLNSFVHPPHILLIRRSVGIPIPNVVVQFPRPLLATKFMQVCNPLRQPNNPNAQEHSAEPYRNLFDRRKSCLKVSMPAPKQAANLRYSRVEVKFSQQPQHDCRCRPQHPIRRTGFDSTINPPPDLYIECANTSGT
ncbi:hypothetical protein C8R43DRAFT_1105169 [Mycena crocata]|nr:hypothetical protein C8R43DRAFT_1105169 [Mycena crocata]